MFKKLLFAASFLALAVPSWSQHLRRVLVEEFTNASCPPCAANNPAFNATLLTRDSIVTPIKYQTIWPGVDPMNAQNRVDVADRVDYYAVNGVPNGIENGATDLGVPGGYTAEQIDAAYNTLTPVTIALTHSLTADYDSVLISVSVTSDAALTGTLKLRVAVGEKTITFAAAPGTNGEKEFYSVMRKMLPDADGTETGDFAAGETKTYSFAWPLDYFYDLNQVEALAWLQDDATKEVWQSERSKPNTVVAGGSYAKVTLTTNASYKLVCTNSLAPVFTLKNTGTEPLTSANIRYKIDEGDYIAYTWTGNVNANLTTSVTLPAATFTTVGQHSVKIQVTSTNSGAQINLVDATGTIAANAMYELTAAPAGSDFENVSLPPAGWGLKNETNGWDLAYSPDAPLGAYGLSEYSMACLFYNLTNGRTVELLMPKLDITALPSAQLTFDHAQAAYTTESDRLRVDVSTDCGATWATLWDKAGAALNTATATTAFYIPQPDEWVSDVVNLNAYAGVSDVLVRFRATSGYGNNLFVDNVLVQAATATHELTSLSKFTVQPNPAKTVSDLRFTLDAPESIQVLVYSIDGTLVQSNQMGDLTAGDHTAQLDANRLPSGSYRVVLQGQKGSAQTQWVVAK